jgi:hypothetical protein
MTELSHRFPPPWEIEDNGACFIVRDHSGQASHICTMRTSQVVEPLPI